MGCGFFMSQCCGFWWASHFQLYLLRKHWYVYWL